MRNRDREIVLADDVQVVLDSYSASFGVRTLLYSPRGDIIAIGSTGAVNARYCRLLQDRLFGVGTCADLDERKRREANDAGRLISYRCHAGLLETLMPLYSGDHLVGYAAWGQVRSADLPPAGLLSAWGHRYDTDELLAAYDELPFIAADRIAAVTQLFVMSMQYMLSRHMITPRRDVDVQRIVDYIAEHVDRPITLGEVAALVHRSESSVSHLFTARLGRSFKRTLVEAKLEKAEEHMRDDPGITIAEAADRVGYSDPFHFSSIYKRYRGYPPKDFLRRADLA